MEERWEFSPVGAGFYCNSQLSNNFNEGPEYRNKFRLLLRLLFGNLSFSPCAQEVLRSLLSYSRVAVVAYPACCPSSLRQLSPDPICY